jgi:hypothetical protein
MLQILFFMKWVTMDKLLSEDIIGVASNQHCFEQN